MRFGRDANAQVRVSLVFPASASGDAFARLEVEDVESGETIVNLDLDPVEFMGLMRSSIRNVPAFVLTADRAHRIGREMQVETVAVPDEIAWADGRWSKEPTEKMRAWAHETRLTRGYETSELRNTNQGWRLLMRRWPEPEGAEA